MAENTGADILRQRTEYLYSHEGMPWSDAEAQARADHPELNTTTPEAPTVQSGASMSVRLRSYADIDDDVPTWVWTYGGNGRVPLGAMTLFAGRPAAGKSTAARWFASAVTRGTLPGEWHGTPHSVAYIAAEESLKYSVKPSLRAAGADMGRVYYPETIANDDIDNARINYIPTAAMSMFAKELRSNDVKLVIVDPLMTMLGGGTDIYRNNEVRERVQPWVDLADQIGGVVIGIAHLNKSVTGDVLAAINGSSAFGELCRAAFGFANDTDEGDGTRVMSQVKNSLGVEDLSLTYSLTPEMVTTASGKSAEMPKFTILGESEKKVGEILRAAGMPATEKKRTTKDVVLAYLRSQPGLSALAEDVKAEVEDKGCSFKTAQNQREQWGVRTDPEGQKKRWTLKENTSRTSDSSRDTSRTTRDGMWEVPSSDGVSTSQHITHPTSHIPPHGSDVSHGPTDQIILGALDTEFGLSPDTVADSVPGLTRADAPARLQALADAGLVAADARGRYTRTTDKDAAA